MAELSEANALERMSDEGQPLLDWGFTLPSHVDSEKIQVNISRLGLIHRVGAFSASTVTEYSGKTSEGHFITGVNPDGSAIAGKGKHIAVERHDSRLIEEDMFLFFNVEDNYGHPVAMHRINRPEAVQNVIGLKEEGKDDTTAWAKVLDATLRQSVRDAGKANLVDKSGPINKFMSLAMATWVATGIIPNGDKINLAPAAIYMMMYSGNLVIDSLINRHHGLHPIKDRRWSLFMNNQMDRYAALNGISRVPGLIKVRK